MCFPHKPGHSRTHLWTRKGSKPLPRLPVSPWVQDLLAATWARAGVALKGPHSPGQGPGPAWQSPAVCARRSHFAPQRCVCDVRPCTATELSLPRPGLERGRACGAPGGSGGMSGVCTHVSACTRTWLCGAQVPMVTVQQQGRACRCQSRGKGRPVRPGLSGTAVGLFHCRARSWSGSHTDTHTSGAGQPGPAGRGRVALRLKDGNQNNRKADEIGTCGESWLPARRWRGAVQVQSHSGAWAGRSAERPERHQLNRRKL